MADYLVTTSKIGCKRKGNWMKEIDETMSLKIDAHRIARTTPPSTRRADPVVAEARGLDRYTIMVATSSMVANLFNRDVGRMVLKNSASNAAASPPAPNCAMK